MAKSKIDWCDAVWNPVVGCKKVSAGCKNCYAERMALRLAAMGRPEYLEVTGRGWTGHAKCLPERLDEPLQWKKPRRIFVNSMSDLFHEDVPDEFIAAVWMRMLSAYWHTFIILTKRPERMAELVPKIFYNQIENQLHIAENVQLGVSVEDQATADERIPWLLKTPAAVRLVSVEPMLGPVYIELMPNALYESGMPFYWQRMNLDGPGGGGIDWIIAGCESGPNARPAEIDWFRSLRDQCVGAGVPFFLKQMKMDGKLVKMPALDRQVWAQCPVVAHV
jgi:protein gp37